MDSVISAYYWAGLISTLNDVLIVLCGCSLGVVLLAIISACVPSDYLDYSTTAKRVAVIAAIFLVLTLATITFLPSEETRQTFIAAKIAAVQNDDTLLPSEREALQKLAATLPQTTKQKHGGQ